MLPVAGLRRSACAISSGSSAQAPIHVGQRRYQEPEELNSLADAFDVAVSGSDQIINKHSNELEHVDWKIHGPVPAEMGELQGLPALLRRRPP